MDVHIGRRPVFDRTGQVVGHELAFRDAEVAHARAGTGAPATAVDLLARVLQRDLGDLVGTGRAYVRLPEPYLVGRVPLTCPRGRLVVQVEEPAGEPGAELIAGLARLRAERHRRALVLRGDGTGGLLAHVDAARIDASRDDLPAVVRRVQERGVAVHAAGVETPEQLRACRDLGVAHLSGRQLQRATPGRPVSPGQAACMQLVGVLDRAEVSTRDVARLVGSDPVLSLRLLTAANAAAVGARRRITALPDALLLLGFEQLRRWALLQLVADLPTETAPGLEDVLLRAAMCERLAAAVDGADPGSAYLVGLVSGLDALLDQPLPELMEQLPLAEDTLAALRHRTGPLGEVLRCVLAYEDGELAVPPGSRLSATAPRQAFVAAVRSTGQPLAAGQR